MSAETASYRVESNAKVERLAIDRAWDAVGRIQRRQRSLDERVEQAKRQYGDGLRVTLGAPPTDVPPASCGRSEIEEYERELRAHCNRTERHLETAVKDVERALKAAWKEARALEQSVRRLEERLAPFAAMANRAGPPQRPSESSYVSAIQTYVERMKAHCASVEDELIRYSIDAERSALAAELGAHLETGSMSADDLFSRPGPTVEGHGCDSVASPGPSAEERVTAVKKECVRVLDRLSTGVSAGERDALDRIAEKASQAQAGNQPERARTLLLELRLGVQWANERWERDAEHVALLRQELRGLDGADVRAVVDEIARIERGERRFTAEVDARAREASAAARARADLEYAATVMREEIGKLGYQVEEGFASLFVEGGRTVARKTGEPGYGVVVDVVEGEFSVEPVRVGCSGSAGSKERRRRRDLEFERRWCQDFAQARAAMNDRGVATGIMRRQRAGARALEVVRDEKKRTGRKRGRTDGSRRRESLTQRHWKSR